MLLTHGAVHCNTAATTLFGIVLTVTFCVAWQGCMLSALMHAGFAGHDQAAFTYLLVFMAVIL